MVSVENHKNEINLIDQYTKAYIPNISYKKCNIHKCNTETYNIVGIMVLRYNRYGTYFVFNSNKKHDNSYQGKDLESGKSNGMFRYRHLDGMLYNI